MTELEQIQILEKAQAKIRQNVDSYPVDDWGVGFNVGMDSAVSVIDRLIKELEAKVYPMSTAVRTPCECGDSTCSSQGDVHVKDR